jgi:hypothetical protein
LTGQSPSGNTKKPWEARLGGETTVPPERSREWYKKYAPDVWARAKAAALAAAGSGGGGSSAVAGGSESGGGGAAVVAGGSGGKPLTHGSTGLQFVVDDERASPAALALASQAVLASGDAPKSSRVPPVSTLNFFFPPATPQRELLERLVGPPAPRGAGGGGSSGGGSGGAGGAGEQPRHRFSAAQALAWLAESPWRDLKTPGDGSAAP